MAWIQTLEPSSVDPASPLGRLYRACVEPETGQIDEILKVHGLRPDQLAAHAHLYRAAMREAAGLNGRERELVAVAVSAANGCGY